MSNYNLLINGKLVEGETTLDVINPATGDVFTNVAKASPAQANEAISAAKQAFTTWSKTCIEERKSKVLQLADALHDNRSELARILTHEQGKPIAEAEGEIDWAEGYLRHYTTLTLDPKVIQDDDDLYVELRRNPLGVVVGIMPWNFPILVAIWKLGPALIAGNTIVLKPAPTTPVATLKMAELSQKIFPDGVVNIIADDNDLGAILTSHPDVAKVTFTGSSATGQKVMASSAATLKRLTLELGGNDPCIVLDDVNIKDAAEKIYAGSFMNAGQVCLAIKRVYVHASIYDKMCDALVEIARSVVVDDGLKQTSTMGPVQNKKQYDKLLRMLERAGTDGRILSGGVRSDKKGFFIDPTIVADVTDGHQIVDEEQFGPILPLIKFTDVEDVIARANNSPFGLGASIWSSDLKKAGEIASQIESGTVWINQHINIGPHIPMAGYKGSGIGVEQSIEGLNEFTQIQVINIAK